MTGAIPSWTSLDKEEKLGNPDRQDSETLTEFSGEPCRVNGPWHVPSTVGPPEAQLWTHPVGLSLKGRTQALSQGPSAALCSWLIF